MTIEKKHAEEITQNDVADKLLFPLFRCIEEDYKSKYFRELWEQYENALRSASFCSSLPQFYQNILKKLPIHPEVQYMKEIRSVLQCGKDTVVLNWLRDETSYLVLLARLINEERKESFKSSEQ